MTKILLCVTTFHPHVEFALHGEFLALLFRLEVIVAEGMSPEEVKSYSLLVIN